MAESCNLSADNNERKKKKKKKKKLQIFETFLNFHSRLISMTLNHSHSKDTPGGYTHIYVYLSKHEHAHLKYRCRFPPCLETCLQVKNYVPSIRYDALPIKESCNLID